ncbi:hypothetical protein ACQ4PT_072307 [Festuca glaucescens]
MAMVGQSLYPIAVLIDELKNEEIPLRLNSIRKLSTIARALGEERTRKELIPFLSENNDDEDEVLQAMAEELGVFVPYVGGVEHAHVLLPPLETLATVEETCVRDKAVELLCLIGAQMKEKDIVDYFVPVVTIKIQYVCWQLKAVPPSGNCWNPKIVLHIYFRSLSISPRADLVPAYVRLLRDNEAEVWIAAAGKVTKFCRILRPQVAIQHILPCVKELSSDSSQHVRSALASVIMGMAPVLGKQLGTLGNLISLISGFLQDATIEQLLPIFLSLLKDEFPDVRLNIISKLDEVNQVIGIDLLSQSLLPAIVELAEDRHWRVRLAIIEYIPLLARQLGVGFFDDKLGALCMQWLEDKVFSIREAAANNLKRLAEEFGPEWAMQHIIPQVLEKINNPHYHSASHLIASPCHGPRDNVVVNSSKERVPNIKFNVAKVLQSLVPILDQSLTEKTLKPCLVELSEDPDVDVRYYAKQALQACDQIMVSS